MPLSDSLTRPTLLLDEARCRRNVQRMVERVSEHTGLRLRPHFKTHQSRLVGTWMKQAGIQSITVSSLTMAKYFAQDGWNDILVAFPLNLHELPAVQDLLTKYNDLKLGLTIENSQALDILAKTDLRVDIYIKVDAGYHRTGIPIQDTPRIRALLRTAHHHPTLKAKGVLLHSGHTYNVHGKDEICRIHDQALRKLASLRQVLEAHFSNLEYSIGDTPSCSVAKTFAGATELRPGNFVFYDVMQYYIGSNNLDDIAVCLACPVVAKHPERHEIILYGGAVHFSKDHVCSPHPSKTIFGLPVTLQDDGWCSAPWQDSYMVKLSQEHGILRVNGRGMESIQVGDWVGILPVHSCLTADCMGGYLTLSGTKVDHMRGHVFD